MLLKLSTAQKLGQRHLYSKNEAALFMGCGLGKTALCLNLARKLFLQGKTIGVLVVAPKRVCNLVWPFEVQKWDQLNWLKVANIRTKEGWDMLLERRAHIYVTNYEQLKKLADKYFLNRRQKTWAFDMVIFDELTKAKNHKSKNLRAVRKYFVKLQRRWGLTGTPSPNGLLDLFGQIRVLDYGKHLGINYTVYRDTYFKAIDYRKYIWKPKSKATKRQIYRALKPIALTIKSSDWLNIPETRTEDVEVSLPKTAVKLYKELEKELYLLLKGEDVTAKNAAVLVNKLLQIASGAIYSDETHSGKTVIDIHDAKVKALVFLAKKIKEPIIVACNFRHEQTRIQAALQGSVRLDSANTEKKEIELQKKWNAKRIPFLIAHPKSIGHGLNLQGGGRHVIWFSPTWDRELYDQLNARVARTGQTEVTEIYHLLCGGTMDDCVMTSLENKDKEQNALLDSLNKFKNTYGR